jgi:hypothetical protein
MPSGRDVKGGRDACAKRAPRPARRPKENNGAYLHGSDAGTAARQAVCLFDLVERMRAIKADNGKPLWAVTNESALSAAYAIASAADRLYVTRTGEAGSVGVVAVQPNVLYECVDPPSGQPPDTRSQSRFVHSQCSRNEAYHP